MLCDAPPPSHPYIQAQKKVRSKRLSRNARTDLGVLQKVELFEGYVRVQHARPQHRPLLPLACRRMWCGDFVFVIVSHQVSVSHGRMPSPVTQSLPRSLLLSPQTPRTRIDPSVLLQERQEVVRGGQGGGAVQRPQAQVVPEVVLLHDAHHLVKLLLVAVVVLACLFG